MLLSCNTPRRNVPQLSFTASVLRGLEGHGHSMLCRRALKQTETTLLFKKQSKKRAILLNVREVSCCSMRGIDSLGVILAAGMHQAVRNLVCSGPAAWGLWSFFRGGEQHSLTTVSCGCLLRGVGGYNSWLHLHWSWIRDLVLERSESRVMGECFSCVLMKVGLTASSCGSVLGQLHAQ